MNQRQLIDKFAEHTGRTKVESKEIISDVLDLITDSLIEGDPVNLYGFGAFSVYTSKPQRKWCPTKKEHFITTPRQAVSFKAGDSLLRALSAQKDKN